MKPVDITKIYNKYLERKSEIDYKSIREKIPEGNHYSASSAGMCSRKIYYKSIEKADMTNLPTPKSYRIMRLGNVIHKDLQDAFTLIKRKEPKENNTI